MFSLLPASGGCLEAGTLADILDEEDQGCSPGRTEQGAFMAQLYQPGVVYLWTPLHERELVLSLSLSHFLMPLFFGFVAVFHHNQ